jgi:hypothetical protein
MPIAVLAIASLFSEVAAGTPKPHEPPAKPKPTAAPVATPAPTAAAAPTATATPAATATASAAHSATTTGSAPAASGSAKPTVATTPSISALSVGRMEDRLEALRKLTVDRKNTLDARRTAEQERTRLRWGSLVDQPAVVTELKTHAERTARLDRITDLGEVEAKPAIVTRARTALNTENVRHEKQMQSLAGGAK